jgi:hypothetical protein
MKVYCPAGKQAYTLLRRIIQFIQTHVFLEESPWHHFERRCAGVPHLPEGEVGNTT